MPEVQQIVFGDEVVEISYIEENERLDGAAMMRTVVIERGLFGSELDDVEREIADLVDEVFVYLRNEDAREERQKAFAKRALTAKMLEAAAEDPDLS